MTPRMSREKAMTGPQLRFYRKNTLQMSMREVAELLGVTLGAVYRWEKGVRPISRLTTLAVLYLGELKLSGRITRGGEAA